MVEMSYIYHCLSTRHLCSSLWRLKCTILITSCPSSVVVKFSHFRLLWKRWTEFNETRQEVRSQCPLPSLCFSRRSGKKTRWPPRPLIGWNIFDFFSETADRIQQHLTESKISMSSTKCAIFRSIRKLRWPPCPIRQQRWHIVLRCTICGNLGPLFFITFWWLVYQKSGIDLFDCCLSLIQGKEDVRNKPSSGQPDMSTVRLKMCMR